MQWFAKLQLKVEKGKRMLILRTDDYTTTTPYSKPWCGLFTQVQSEMFLPNAPNELKFTACDMMSVMIS
jgi:hypothetical protein